MRKILYSPGYGAGWTSWADSSDEAKFAIDYAPIIEFLEGGGVFVERPWGRAHKGADAFEEPGRSVLKKFEEDLAAHLGKDHVYFYLGGARDLQVAVVNGPVRINEYDGFESVEEPGDAQYL